MSGAETPVDERELEAALRGLCPEPAAFRAAVERRLRAAEAAGGGAAELRASDGPWWRRAAAWLPAELVPGALAGAGAKLSWKALPGLVALPALAFAMLVAPVVLALQSLASEEGARGKERLAAVSGWWREHRRAGLVALAVLGLLFLYEPASAGMALLLVSTGVLALLLARLNAAGFGQRADVARHCGSLLVSLAIWMVLLDGPWRALFPSERAAKLGFVVLALGAVSCSVVALRARHATLWHLLTRSRAGDAARLLQVAIFSPWALLVGWSAFSGGTGLAEQARHVAELRPYDRRAWELAGRAVAWLRREGVEPELEGLRAHWHARRDAPRDPVEGLLPAGIELGFVERGELAALAREGRTLLDDEGPIWSSTLRERPELLALVRSGSLGEDERDRLAARLRASSSPEDEHWALARLAKVVALLDELGRSTVAQGLLEDAHALLARCWVPPGRFLDRGAGFVAPPWREKDHISVWDTHDAVDLMLRFGVPAGIDPVAVARGLERHTRLLLPWSERRQDQGEATLALAKLRRGLLPEPTPLAWLAANRVLLALALLVGFCLAATLRAPRAPPA